MRPGVVPFEAKLDGTEPMGMETFVYFDVAGVPASGRVSRTHPQRTSRPGVAPVGVSSCRVSMPETKVWR
jgi:hypothetical protein